MDKRKRMTQIGVLECWDDCAACVVASPSKAPAQTTLLLNRAVTACSSCCTPPARYTTSPLSSPSATTSTLTGRGDSMAKCSICASATPGMSFRLLRVHRFSGTAPPLL
jgi:hypothetical protein